MTRRKLLAVAALIAAIALATFLLWPRISPETEVVVVRYGITPYQDSALPVVAERRGWYAEENLRVELVPLTWDQVMPALRSGTIDAAIYNFNSFLPAYANSAEGTDRAPVFYSPLYVFHGQAIMVRRADGMRTLDPSAAPARAPTPAEVAAVAAQLRGKRIAITRGTELEQIVLAALSAAGLTERDVTIIHAAPEDSLAAFIAGDVDAFAAGLTERVEARRRGGIELLTQSDVMSPVTDGLVTTRAFARDNPEALDKLVRLWFRTIEYVGSDVQRNSTEIRDYLRTSASTRYSPEEYAIAWSFEFFPRSPAEARQVFSSPTSRYYWRRSWDDVGRFLVEHGTIRSAPPHEAYMGDAVLTRLSR
ncbi:MAG: NitT/TauT family transport system substrate-binding protein [Sphingomonadales bacterium]|jgi:ABC-type nitrate/sulfonate/bicarbonate transport system substrate-binding protein|nr:NitT/TauT family transport system substrate-binding protein [Sphingomonadales bacterium]